MAMYLNLKLCIWQSGLRQNRLAQALHLDEALLSRIINGYRPPTAEQRAQIAQFLQKDEAWLFAEDADQSKVLALDAAGSAPKPAEERARDPERSTV